MTQFYVGQHVSIMDEGYFDPSGVPIVGVITEIDESPVEPNLIGVAWSYEQKEFVSHFLPTSLVEFKITTF